MLIAALVVAVGLIALLSAVCVVLLQSHFSGLCENWALGDITSPGGDYQANVVRDDCDETTGTVYWVHIARDADGFEEPGVKPDRDNGEVAGQDAVRVQWASNDTLVISSRPSDNVSVSFGLSDSVTVRRQFPSR